MRALKTITQPINEAVIVRPEVSFMQAMKALGKIIISLPGCTRYIHPEEILYIKAESNYSEIYLVQGQKFLLSKTLKEIEAELPSHIFFRIHRGYCVNISHVTHLNKNIEGWTLLLINKEEVPVSRDKKSLFVY